MPDVVFRLLGPMEIVVAGRSVRLPGPAERSLLAQLLLAPARTIPATVLVDRLWAESALPADPINALQIRVSKLRRAMGAHGLPDLVVREGAGYRANVPAESVDAVDFAARLTRARASFADAGGRYTDDHLEAYDEALTLWRGEPLADFRSDAWAMVESGRLNELRLAALTERAEIALALGRHLEVSGDLEPLVAQDPTLESLAALLMVALYRSGRQADALEVYTRTRRMLDEELGLEPSLSLRSLHERILRQDASLGAVPRETPGPIANAPRHRRVESHTSPTNLPVHVRSLIGRDEQLDALIQLLGGLRLLTLIGPGGAGKTSLAMAVVARARDDFPDGAYGVRLASVNSGEQVAHAVADALGVPLDGAAADSDIRGRLLSFLAGRHLLLLVDNCEHVVDAAAALVDDILGRCPRVTVIATSREALAIPDEVQVTVGPLATPPEGTPPERVLDHPAAQLFVERARAVRPGALLDATDLEAVGRIARALDGIPLALELAASRVTAMSPVEISERLDDRFSLLTSGTRTAEARQQTLRATVDWSYALLTDIEQRVFDRLAVFQGGWTLSAAEAVLADDAVPTSKVVDTIGRLVERSMVVAERGAVTRYRMLETLRQYAVERLDASPEPHVLHQRHAAFYRRFVEEAERDLRGRGQRDAFSRLREEQPNIRAALTWLEGPAGDPDAALSMAGSLGLFWHLGRHLEGREVLSRVLARAGGAPAARARGLQAVSLVERPRACLVHPSSRCAAAAEESLRLFEELDDPSRAALSRVLLAVEGVTGRHADRMKALLREAEDQFAADGDAWGTAVSGFVRMEAALKSGDEANAVPIGRATAAAFRHLDDPWGLSATLYHLGWGLRQFGRYEEGARVLEEAIDVAGSAGLFNTVQWALADLGIAQLHLGDCKSAQELFDRAAEASRHIGDGAGEVLSEYGRGLMAQVAGDWPRARRRFTSASRGFTDLGTPVMEGLALAGIARCDEAEGIADQARKGYEDARQLARAAGEPSLEASALEGLARLEHAAGNSARAAELAATAGRLRDEAARPPAPHEARDLRVLGDLAPTE